jgi:hypothetical protein
MMRERAARCCPGAETQMPTPTAAIIARADQFQAAAPTRTLQQWAAMVEHNGALLSDSLSWFDKNEQRDQAALMLVRDRLAGGGAL